jgi:hypothetical protein
MQGAGAALAGLVAEQTGHGTAMAFIGSDLGHGDAAADTRPPTRYQNHPVRSTAPGT